jgi:lipopolysaccharide biosynthesis glycosyltransferase
MLACDVSAAEAERAEGFLKGRGAPVEIIKITAERFQRFRVDSYVSASTYSRLLLPEFFDDRWDRLLYVDADTRIMVPLQSLLDTSLEGKPVGAVHDYLQYIIYGVEGSRERLGLLHNAPYFNAGVMYFDWRRAIESGLLERARAFAIENPDLCKSHDQDALNKAFEGAWAPLDPRWNFMNVAIPDEVFRLSYPERLRPYISHFAGSLKPWMLNSAKRFECHRAWYWRCLRESPWPHFVAPASAPPDESLVALRPVQVRKWLLAQRGKLRTAFRHRSTVVARRRGAAEQSVLPNELLPEGEINLELVHLLDQMIAEAAGSIGRVES